MQTFVGVLTEIKFSGDTLQARFRWKLIFFREVDADKTVG